MEGTRLKMLGFFQDQPFWISPRFPRTAERAHRGQSEQSHGQCIDMIVYCQLAELSGTALAVNIIGKTLKCMIFQVHKSKMAQNKLNVHCAPAFWLNYPNLLYFLTWLITYVLTWASMAMRSWSWSSMSDVNPVNYRSRPYCGCVYSKLKMFRTPVCHLVPGVCKARKAQYEESEMGLICITDMRRGQNFEPLVASMASSMPDNGNLWLKWCFRITNYHYQKWKDCMLLTFGRSLDVPRAFWPFDLRAKV